MLLMCSGPGSIEICYSESQRPASRADFRAGSRSQLPKLQLPGFSVLVSKLCTKAQQKQGFSGPASVKRTEPSKKIFGYG